MPEPKIELIDIDENVAIASPYPCLFMRRETAIVAADLHIGLEAESERRGIHIPRSTIPKLIRSVVEPAKTLGCRLAILLGDVKHEFGMPKEEEWWGVRLLFRELRSIGCEPEVIRGNHDNYIVYILKELSVTLHDLHLEMGDLLLTHGHREVTDIPKNVKHIIMGNEHPAIAVRDDTGVKHRFKAFITGHFGGRRITVIPSVSLLSPGIEINEAPPQMLLSPLLRKVDLREFTPYLIEPGVYVKKFPAMKHVL